MHLNSTPSSPVPDIPFILEEARRIAASSRKNVKRFKYQSRKFSNSSRENAKKFTASSRENARKLSEGSRRILKTAALHVKGDEVDSNLYVVKSKEWRKYWF